MKPTTCSQMSLRWTSCMAQKRQTAVFHPKSLFAWRKSAAKFLCLKTVSDRVVGHSLVYLSVQKWLVGGRPLLRGSLANTDWPTPLHNVDLHSIFAHSSSSVTAREKSSIKMNRKFTMRIPMSLRRIVYIDPTPPIGGCKMQSVHNLNNNLQ